MKVFQRKARWYAAGLAFDCQRCGQCCAGPQTGHVWVTDREVSAIADFLDISEEEARRRYVRKVNRRFSLIEEPRNNDCIFLGPDETGGVGCRIYGARPVQCRTWPFWSSNLATPDDWALAGMRCSGINRGQLFSRDEIEDRRKATGD